MDPTLVEDPSGHLRVDSRLCIRLASFVRCQPVQWGSMQRMPAISRPTWMLALSGVGDRIGAPRRSPVEIVATMGSYVTRTQAAEVSGLRTGPFGRWADGIAAMREDCAAFARHWQAHHDRGLALDRPP